MAAKSNWREIAKLLQSDGEQAGLNRVFPDSNEGLSLLAGLGSSEVAADTENVESGSRLQSSLEGLINQLAVFEDISRCPILAITGLLNAGKSSLLASFLTPENRKRVLRGLDNESGTHRFVLWLPQLWWDDAELLSTLISFLTSLFGHAPEHLSDDPTTAALQYNGRVVRSSLMQAEAVQRESPHDEVAPSESGSQSTDATADVDPMNVPLIAYDSGLNELKLGLVDCPDIQTGFVSGAGSGYQGEELAEVRRQHLAKIGRLCSAFAIVSKLNNLHDEGLLSVLSTLRDAMPGVPRLLAVNKIKSRYSPTVVAEQTRALVDRFGISYVYIAYDYRSAFADTRIPPTPPRMQLSDDGESLPIFFEAAPQDDGVQEPLPVNKPQLGSMVDPPASLNYLHDLGNRLDAGSLSAESGRSLNLQLRAKAAEAIDWLKQNDRKAAVRVQDLWHAIADACYEFMAERNAEGQAVGLRLQASPAIVAQMADSLQRTAPVWMKVSLSIDRTARQFQQVIADSASRFKILQSASESVTQFAKRFRRGEGAQVVTPQRLAKAIRTADIHDGLKRTPQEDLEVRCEQAMKRFAEEDKTLLNQEQLDEWSRQVWAGMSFKDKLWKGTQPLAVMMAPLLAAILVPIDGGGTAVLVFASTKELLAAAGIAAVMTPMATGGEALKIVHRETPWRQLSDLFAILCDAIGIPRAVDADLPTSKCDGEPRKLLPCSLKAIPLRENAAVNRWMFDEKLLSELHLQLKKLA